MRKILTLSIFSLFIFFHSVAQARFYKHIYINNNSYKSVYYSVIADYQLGIGSEVFGVQHLAPWQLDIINIGFDHADGMIEMVFIEDTGPYQQIKDSGNAKPICEFSVHVMADDTMPLEYCDLNNFSVSELYGRVDPDLITFTIQFRG